MSVTPILENVWYFGLPSSELAKGKMKSLVICGEPVVFFRNEQGQVAALRDICPHRGIPLSYGQVLNGEVECPYHGWTFNREGQCTRIPSLTKDQDLDCRKIRVKNFPVKEHQGLIWIFRGDKNADPSKAPPIPEMKFWGADVKPKFHKVVDFPCHIDHAVIGLMDPAHGPYVHKSWFWRSAKQMHEKRKKFGPVDHGFQMIRHKPSSNSKAYKIFGGAPTTEINFSLPSVRVEHILVGERNFVSYTALTPVTENLTRVSQMAYWDIPWLGIFSPFIKGFANVFLGQDRDAVTKQQDGLRYDPSLMLIKDADTQAKWYYGLKDELLKSRVENRSFVNPVQETELKWRS